MPFFLIFDFITKSKKKEEKKKKKVKEIKSKYL